MNSTRLESPSFGAKLHFVGFTQRDCCAPRIARLTRKIAKDIKLPEQCSFQLHQYWYGDVGKVKFPVEEKELNINILNSSTGQLEVTDVKIFHQLKDFFKKKHFSNFGELKPRTASKRVSEKELSRALKRKMEAMAKDARQNLNELRITAKNSPIIDALNSLQSSTARGNTRRMRQDFALLASTLGFNVSKKSPKRVRAIH